MNNPLQQNPKHSEAIAPKAASIPAYRSVFNTFNRDHVNKMIAAYGEDGIKAVMLDAAMKCHFTGNIPADETSCVKIAEKVHGGKDACNRLKKILLEEGSWVENNDKSIHMSTHNTKRNEFTNKYKHFKYEIDTNKSLKILVKEFKMALLKDNLSVQKRMLGIEKTNNRRTPTDIVACGDIARHHYDAFLNNYVTTVFLGCKSAGNILGKSRSSGARYLKLLEQEGYTRKKNKFKLGSMDNDIFRDMEEEWTRDNKFGRMFHSSTGLATLVFADSWTWNKQPVAQEEATAGKQQPGLMKAYDLQGGVYYYKLTDSQGPSEEVMRAIEEIMKSNRSITC